MAHDPIIEAYDGGKPRPRLVHINGSAREEEERHARKNGPLLLHAAELPDPEKISPRQWLYGTQLIRGYVTVLVAQGGTGKSAYAMAVVLALCSGVSILGDHIFLPVNGAIFNLEDPMDELNRRVAALLMRHKIERGKIRGKLFLDTGEDRGLTIAAIGADGFSVINPDEDALIAQIREHDIGVLICDPYAESHSLEENSNPHMVKAAAAWRRVARATNCAILLLHHVRKGDASGIDAARGAKALTDSARVGLLLSVMTEEEAKAFNLNTDDRWQYVRLDDVKRNMAPAARARWFQLDQVSLGNVGDPLYPNGDRVAAIVPWEPPAVWDTASSSQLNAALDVIAEPPAGWLYAAHRRGRDNKRWAGLPIIDALGCSDKQATIIIAAWLKSGLLFEEEYHDTEQRKSRTGVRVDHSRRPSQSAYRTAT